MGDGLSSTFYGLTYGMLPMLPYLTAGEQEGERRPLTAKEKDKRKRRKQITNKSKKRNRK